jgi:hypothetical protein
MFNERKLNPPANSNPGIMLSGGSDSSLLLWLLTYKNIKVTPYTVDRKNGSLHNSYKIVDWINNYFNLTIPYPIVVGDPTLSHGQQVKSGHDEVLLSKQATHLYLGTTQNPPIELPGNPPFRQIKIQNPKLLTPFLSLNKRDIYDLYKLYNILDLFEITQSCERYTDKHCGECFSCNERKWGTSV